MNTLQQEAIEIAKRNPLISLPHLVLIIAAALGVAFDQAEALATSQQVTKSIQR